MSLSFSDAAVGTLDFLVEAALFGNLTSMLVCLAIALLLEALDLTPHLGTLGLDAVGLVAQRVLLALEIVNTGSLSVILSVEAGDLAVLLVEEHAVAASLIGEIMVFTGLLLEQVLQVLQLLAVVTDIVSSAVEAAAVVVLGAQLVIRKHAIAIFH